MGADVTNAEWAWWFIKLNQRCWHVYFAWYFTMCFVKFESTVVTFDSGVVGLEMCGIVFENVRNWCLFHYKNLVRPVRPYHWGTLTQLPVTHLLHNASGWQVPGQVALSGNCKHCAKYPWLCSVIQQIWCWLPFSSANGCWCGILNA